MPRIDENGKAYRGSQFQTYVNHEREFLNRELALLLGDASLQLDWRSSLVEESFREYQDRSSVDWSASYYQYANRLAHLNWLRSKVSTRLVNVYFVGDSHTTPTSKGS